MKINNNVQVKWVVMAKAITIPAWKEVIPW
jgi:hypothetical protein